MRGGSKGPPMQYPRCSQAAILRRIFTLLLVLIAFLVTARPTFAGSTYYLATTGSDSSAGTAAAPWQTFARSAPGMQAGTDYATGPVVSITVDTATGIWRSFDVTAIVQGWIDGASPNNGFVLRSPTRGVKPLFYSSGYASNPALRPKLTVTY